MDSHRSVSVQERGFAIGISCRAGRDKVPFRL